MDQVDKQQPRYQWAEQVRRTPNLPCRAKVLASALADRMFNSERPLWCCPSRATLAKDCGYSPSSVDRAKEDLEASGLLFTEELFVGGPLTYQALQPLATGDDTPHHACVTPPSPQVTTPLTTGDEPPSPQVTNKREKERKKEREKSPADVLIEILGRAGLPEQGWQQREIIAAEWVLRDPHGWEGALYDAAVEIGSSEKSSSARWCFAALRNKGMAHKPKQTRKVVKRSDMAEYVL